ncbi:N-6 DNA methylase [Patescibacteria group bacterium]|nr:N-6 DNA methylase [Patescibacteria group bacterium]MBU4600487.1 N-6 DNA methylase [Patescibacteria group bacterium]MCG2697848.1 N-6 DNA methylase [Candidatus Parcubacteria bacterium]
MLDQETKRKIDSARDILVGKVPDPKAQVEQITTALIYKFMDDMDRQAEELGGKPSFFTNGFEKYSWGKLMDPKLGSQARIDLYVEAITGMSQNPHLPQLFRDIFKDAFLPYRSPETLSMFLKEINGFNYDNSENLGNAFEYLLSVMAAQGDAGQFRTPRHIIDFIVDVVNPQKDETILDPACGTAGFLISAYKHIIADHDGKDNITSKPTNKEKPLTPDEKKRMMNNFVGYDISPDMVKLSRVNMYLHGFSEPKIYEYDTLSSEDRWDESYDVIMANPPFMSPKGGIRPHKRFSVQANRSEVLFVDYILEHLNQKGRAGIIVPEGIIFQSANAYKKLRQLLIEDGLFAVVSLPAGVFNPYSGVKTSILFFDNQIAKLTKNILFVKITDDGFNLGAQRRKLNTDGELPIALQILKTYREGFNKGIGEKFKIDKSLDYLTWLVSKEKIAKSGDYNLSGERYKAIETYGKQKWPVVKLRDVVIDMKDGGTPSRQHPEYFGGQVKWCIVKDIKPKITETKETLTELGLKNSSAKVWPKNSIIISLGASIGHVGIAKAPVATKQGLSGIVVDEKKILPEFLYYILLIKKEIIQSFATGVTIKEVRPSKLKELFIFPLPSLEVQKEIVAEVDGYQKIIDGAKQVVENWKPKIKIDAEWEMVEFEKVCTLEYGSSLPKQKRINGIYPVMGSNGISGYHNEFLIKGPVIIVGRKGSAGEVVWVNENCFPIDTTYYVKLNNLKNTDLKFIYFILKSLKLRELKGGAGIPGLNRNDVYAKHKIFLPSLKIQKQIVAKIEAEQEIIEQSKKLIGIMEQKITNVLSEI